MVPVPAGGSGEPEHADAHGDGHGGHGIHMPSPSYWPIVSSLGFPIAGYGIIFDWWLAVAGAVVMMIGLFGWILEPSAE